MKDLNKKFIEACENGDLETVRHLLLKEGERADIHAKDGGGFEDGGFRWACEFGRLNIVQYLLTSPELEEHADIHACNNSALQMACGSGHMDIVQYLLTSPELKKHADIQGDCFSLACMNGKVETVQYLLTKIDLKERIDTHQMIKLGFVYACREKHMDMVQYLLTHPDIKDYVDIHENGDAGFHWACANGDLDMVRYLVSSSELQEHSDVKSPSSYYKEPDYGFKLACEHGHDHVADFLLGFYKEDDIEPLLNQLEDFAYCKKMQAIRQQKKKMTEEFGEKGIVTHERRL